MPGRRLLQPPYRRVPWKNGLGSTLEIATDAEAPGGAWTWRLSFAEVPARAPFSRFPGIDRHIAVLEGAGMTLEHAGRRIRVPREGTAYAFAGEDDILCEPDGPGVRDANLMLDRYSGKLLHIDFGDCFEASMNRDKFPEKVRGVGPSQGPEGGGQSTDVQM